MKYLGKSFSVAGSGGSATYCAEHGHTLPDRHGKCLRCSAKVRFAEVVSEWPLKALDLSNGFAIHAGSGTLMPDPLPSEKTERATPTVESEYMTENFAFRAESKNRRDL